MKNVLSTNEDIYQLFYPLLKSTISHVMKSGIQEGLTGPIKRGDEKTIKMHLNFLNDKYPDLINTYTQLTQELVSISELNDDRKKRLIDILNSDFNKNFN